MTENGDPLENVVAEKVNGIIKDEYLDNYHLTADSEAKKLLESVVNLYNNERPDMSISNLTPNQLHQTNDNIKTERLRMNYYKK